MADRQVHIEIHYPPRGLRAPDAARYMGLSRTKFYKLVDENRLPKPKRVDGCTIWDRLELDAAFDDLNAEGDVNEWD